MSDNKTEKPTPRRRQKAREQGQVARSRDLSGILACRAHSAWSHGRAIRESKRGEACCDTPLSIPAEIRYRPAAPYLFGRGWTLAQVCSASDGDRLDHCRLLGGLAQGGLVFAPEALVPKDRAAQSGEETGTDVFPHRLERALEVAAAVRRHRLCRLRHPRDHWIAIVIASNTSFWTFGSLPADDLFEVRGSPRWSCWYGRWWITSSPGEKRKATCGCRARRCGRKPRIPTATRRSRCASGVAAADAAAVDVARNRKGHRRGHQPDPLCGGDAL